VVSRAKPQGQNIMITIDLVQDYERKTEKPQQRTAPGAFTWRGQPLDPIYDLATDRHAILIQAAQQARLANSAGKNAAAQVPVDVQRYAEKTVVSVSLVERYARRIFRLAE
jgi:hypothetical protein